MPFLLYGNLIKVEQNTSNILSFLLGFLNVLSERGHIDTYNRVEIFSKRATILKNDEMFSLINVHTHVFGGELFRILMLARMRG